jgi:hypothetical protein
VTGTSVWPLGPSGHTLGWFAMPRSTTTDQAETAGFLNKTVFTCSEVEFRWHDVVAYARASNLWDQCEARTRSSFAAMAGGQAGPKALKQAQREFRVARRLFSADELFGWLRRWDLTVDDLSDHLCRHRLQAVLPGTPSLSVQAIDRAVLVDAICFGMLESWAERLGERTAVCLARGEVVSLDTSALDQAFSRHTNALVTAEALEQSVQSHFLTWTLIESHCVWHVRPAVLAELRQCVLSDGLALRNAAEQAAVPVEHANYRLADAAGPLIASLQGSQSGDLLGPFEVSGMFVLLEVIERRPPALDQPEIRTLAEADVLGRVARHMAASLIEWAPTDPSEQ